MHAGHDHPHHHHGPPWRGRGRVGAAIRLTALNREVAITIKPGPSCVNPVFEFGGVPEGEIRVLLGGRPLDAQRYAWDGRTLWLDATIATPTELRVVFASDGRVVP